MMRTLYALAWKKALIQWNEEFELSTAIPYLQKFLHGDISNEELFREVCKLGLYNVAKFMVDNKYIDLDYNDILWSATYGGDIEMVKLALELGAADYDWMLRYAAWGGHMAIVELALKYLAVPGGTRLVPSSA